MLVVTHWTRHVLVYFYHMLYSLKKEELGSFDSYKLDVSRLSLRDKERSELLIDTFFHFATPGHIDSNTFCRLLYPRHVVI